MTTTTTTMTTFEIGDVVELQSDPNRRLTVLDPNTDTDLQVGDGTPQVMVGHFTDAGEFEDFVVPAPALRKA